ncbi:uncharacterized protein LOC121422706 [Lytechinus variegatus]|uniref:uncharacterized protein LOC121422706 n=1 Tax=Lytechinus variegatus TaxID=7654 RepID=UPI001BB20B58|nr:uncharacterized protein LOC121422706 [Lytechinus variegatus]XP_041473809.1 uncharacterized protein LOC121422706 [Lytechinus variegatus]
MMRKSGKNLYFDCSDDDDDDVDDVYYDAPEEPNDVSTTSSERRRKKQAENKSNKVQAPMKFHFSTQSFGRWRTGSNNGTSKQPRNVSSHSRETGFSYKKDISDSPTGTQTRAGVFHFDAGGPSSSTTSERDTTRPSALGTRPPTIGTRPPTIGTRPPTIGTRSSNIGTRSSTIGTRSSTSATRSPTSETRLQSHIPEKGHQSKAQTSVHEGVASNSKPTSKLAERKIKPSTFSSSLSVGMQTRSSKPVIFICTSYGLHSIKGLTEMVQNSVKQCYSSCEIKETELPYSGLDDFKFPSEASKRDAMILCHSVNNRGFSITDVPNSLYNVFLKYCNQLFGKDRVAVIVHDFECSQEILTINLQQFERTQPTAYKLAGFVALAEDLNTSDARLCYYPESPGLDSFVRKLR